MRSFLMALFAALLGAGAALFIVQGQEKELGQDLRQKLGQELVQQAPLVGGTEAAERIRETLLSQAQAWNNADIDAFMEDYWKSSDLRFASGGSINLGWEVTKARYKSRYPDREAMGVLAFTDLDIQLLSHSDALVFGRWKLTRSSDAPSGLFTLHWRKIDQEWKIVSDHTSSSD